MPSIFEKAQKPHMGILNIYELLQQTSANARDAVLETTVLFSKLLEDQK